MKKFLLPAIAATLIFMTSCNNSPSTSSASGGESDKAKKNLENANAIPKMFENGDFSKVGDYIAANAVDHAGMRGEVKGVDSIKAMLQYYNSMMKDAKNESVKELADDDYVFNWIKESWTAAADNPMMQMKAGQHYETEAIHVTKHNSDGKITDHWEFLSVADMMKMMPGQNMNMGGEKMGSEKMGGEKMGKDTSMNKMQKK